MDANATVEPKTAMDNFTRTMKALFKVPKSELQEKREPQTIKKPRKAPKERDR